ncbi:sugar ABC transporter ATP-binding protein [Actinomadura viridis]|uniref:Ribose transport system ATP-binding protein n=1 Tax=Actinomadura viridis TaxID=58110 RepID=A0A931DDM4_9ACTN|nr:sugar ABC transporter ATP-binding protein [Actinomadura viridis]MBG6089144.1 ribose transport system ATP-binding protein [Actinomadura viridis]
MSEPQTKGGHGMGAPLLEMKGIVKRFPGTLACDGANLSVRAGEVHCLLGENGAGKSTLMKILAGSYRPDAGEIVLAGRPLKATGPQDGIAAGISVIYQELDLAPDLTVAQNLFLGRAPARGPFVRGRARSLAAEEYIRKVGGTFAPGDRVRDLPIAAQQLTAIAKALTTDAKVIVMDEPSATLGSRDLEVVFSVIRDLVAEGRSIIYISHRLDEVSEIGDRATVMRDGRDVGVFDLATTGHDELVGAMIGGARDLVRRADRPVPSGEPRLTVERVRVGDILDVSGVEVRPGEIVGLAGLAGAGRTTLLNALFGAVRGEVRAGLDGRPLPVAGPRTAVRNGLALVPESRKEQGLFLGLGVARNAAVAALGWAAPRSRGKRIAAPILKDLGVKHASPDQPVGQLSGGNQQKVVLAKWIARGMRVLLLDEPTRGLDIGAKADLYRQVRRLADDGVAVLMASSELAELTAHADTVWVLHEGRNIARFDPRTTPEADIAHTVITGATP